MYELHLMVLAIPTIVNFFVYLWFRAYYNQVLSQFPFEQKYIKTAFGKTFMLTAGQESNPPVILLHGSCSNSAFWFPEMMALSENYRVFAVDIIGEAGNSEEYRPDLMIVSPL